MATDTATIRVARSTHDILSRQARQRRMSVAALLAQLAREQERAATFQSERQAWANDAANPAALEELRDWETTLSDGID